MDKKGGRGGGSAKSPRLSTRGGGVSGCPHGQRGRRIMVNHYEKLHILFSSDLRMQYIEDDQKLKLVIFFYVLGYL